MTLTAPISDDAVDAALASDSQSVPEKRPDVKPRIIDAVNNWFLKTDSQVQRANALFEYREANKTLFPARFNPTDPRRGQTQQELKNGKDHRRVQTPYIYRSSIQITAMTVPEDFAFEFEPKRQVDVPAQPGMPTPTLSPDPTLTTFAQTLSITLRELLDEAKFIPKMQAWVQDSTCFPAAILKCTFRREYQTASLNPNPGDKDETDAIARLTGLAKQFASGDFTKDDAKYQNLIDLFTSLQTKARISRWYGLDLQLVPLDAFGISEEATDLVNIYDAPFMWHDALMTGEEILAKHPYRAGATDEDETFGVLPEELTNATPWDTTNSSTDPSARNRSSRNKQLTAPKATPVNATTTIGTTGVDPLKRQYVVREVWSKRDKTVFTLIRGITHNIDKFCPQKTSERWYPFAILAPNRVPTEIYGASDVELKRDIQARIHRKRTDEEKARFLSLPRGIFNRMAGTDEKEMVKLQDIPPGQLRGINFGTTQTKIDDMVQWFKYDYNPESFNTTKDEQDMDQMGALPVQALGQTGSAKFATEVSVAASGSNVATQFRKGIVQREAEGFLTAIAEVVLQELVRDEVVAIAGGNSVWPEIFDEVEAQQIVADAKDRAMQAAAPIVLQKTVQMMKQGMMPDEATIKSAMQAQATPIWQSEMTMKYGNPEPVTRESLYRRLKVRVKSTFNSRMDKQQNLMMFNQLAQSLLPMVQAAQASGTPFVVRPIILYHADLIGGEKVVDDTFPSISPAMIAQSLAQGMLAQAQAAGPNDGQSPGTPPAAGGMLPTGRGMPDQQGPLGDKVIPEQQAQNALQSAPNPM